MMARSLPMMCFVATIGLSLQSWAAEPVLKQGTKKVKLHAVRIKFKHSGMGTARTIGRANQNPGVVTGDGLDFFAELQPELPLQDTRYTWSGIASGNGSHVAASFPVPSNPELTLDVLDRNANASKSFTATIRVRHVGTERETDICPTQETTKCGLAATDAGLAEYWAESGDLAVALGFTRQPCTSDDGKCNSAKHAYWNLLMVRDTGNPFAARLATAHERFSDGYIFSGTSGLDAGSAHNSVVMDLENNDEGRTIAARFQPFTSFLPLGDEGGKTAIATAVTLGQMTKLDTSRNLSNTNPDGAGLLEPSNQ